MGLSPGLGKRTNVLLGLKVGLALATAFSIWVTVVRVTPGPGAFARFGLSWTEIVALYYGSLCLGGAAYGAVESLRRYLWGAMLQGFLLVLPMYSSISVAVGLSLDRTPSVGRDLLLAVIVASVGGSALGVWVWMEEQPKKRKDQPAAERLVSKGRADET